MPLQIIRQDITKMRVDAIVNTTNGEKIGYSGVDLAVHTVAGSGLDKECSKLPLLELGKAQITGGYKLPCKYVIHTRGPIWYGGKLGESAILRSCYIESLKLAVKHRCSSVAFPLISAGVYQYPKDQVLKFAIRTITEFLFDHELTVYICVFDKDSYSFSQKLFSDIKAYIDDEYTETYNDDYYEAYGVHEGEKSKDSFEIRYRSLSRDDEDAFLSKCAKPILHDVPQKTGKAQTLREYLRQRDKSFRDTLFELIDKSGMTDVECYKGANVDKRTFSKIKSGKGYSPSKQTVIAFAISLKLDLDDTQALLATVGFTLSTSTVFDVIIRFFIQNKNYNIFEINEALFEFDQTLLGSVNN